MTVRITLSDDQPAAPATPTAAAGPRVDHSKPPPAVYADWDDSNVAGLLLFLPDEPEIGRRFSYSGVDWEIVDYRNGWVARLLVD